MNTPGDRVGAIMSAILSEKDKTCSFLGYGVYEGDFVPDEGVGGFGDIIREDGMTNPRLRLDNGDVVWGCECWWSSEDKIKKELTKYDKVNIVSIHDYRRKT